MTSLCSFSGKTTQFDSCCPQWPLHHCLVSVPVTHCQRGGGVRRWGAYGNAARQVVDGLRTEVCGQQKQSNDPRNNQHNPNTPTTGRRWRANGTSCHIQHSPSTPTTGLRKRGNHTSRSSRRSGRQKAATRCNMQREDRVTVQGSKRNNNQTECHTGGQDCFRCRQTSDL